MIVLNYTPHVISIVDAKGDVVRSYPPVVEGGARVRSTASVVDNIDGVDVVTTSYGQVDNLPDAKDGIILIVSMVVKAALPGRADLVQPDTGPASVVRYTANDTTNPALVGQIKGVKRFQR